MTTSTKPYACSGCNKAFATQTACSQHMRSTRHGLPFACQPCTKFFATAAALASHAAAKRHVAAAVHADAVSETGASSDTSTSGILLTPSSSSAASHPVAQHTGDTGDADHRHKAAQDGEPDSILGSPRTWSFVSADEDINQSKTASNDLASAMDTLALADSGSSSSSSSSSSSDNGDGDTQETSLDRFFGSFVSPGGFVYDRRAPPSVSFSQLKNHLGASLKQPELQVIRRRFHVAIDNELDEHYGARNDVTAWQTLSRIVLTGEPGQSITACKKALQSIHLNIFDLVAFARRAAADGAKAAQQQTHIKIFPSTNALRKYSRKHQKVFPLVGGAKLNGDQSAGLAAFLRFFGGSRKASY